MNIQVGNWGVLSKYHSVASVTIRDSTCSPYDFHLASNNKDSGVLMNISKFQTAFQKLLTKLNARKRNKNLSEILTNYF